jgi:hypothetical protein
MYPILYLSPKGQMIITFKTEQECKKWEADIQNLKWIAEKAGNSPNGGTQQWKEVVAACDNF